MSPSSRSGAASTCTPCACRTQRRQTSSSSLCPQVRAATRRQHDLAAKQLEQLDCGSGCKAVTARLACALEQRTEQHAASWSVCGHSQHSRTAAGGAAAFDGQQSGCKRQRKQRPWRTSAGAAATAIGAAAAATAATAATAAGARFNQKHVQAVITSVQSSDRQRGQTGRQGRHEQHLLVIENLDLHNSSRAVCCTAACMAVLPIKKCHMLIQCNLWCCCCCLVRAGLQVQDLA